MVDYSRKNPKALFARDFLVAQRDGPKTPHVFHEYPEDYVFVIGLNIFGRKNVPVSENEGYELRVQIRESLLKGLKHSQERTVAPRDHKSVCGPQRRFSIASGLLYMSAPIG